MTHDDDLDQDELRELLAERAIVSPTEVEPLRRVVAQLPPRRRSWGRGILAAAAGIVVVLASLGALAIAAIPWGSSGAAPQPPNPAAFAGDPRLAVCHAEPKDAVAIFELAHLSDYSVQLPNAYPLVSVAADPNDPALVVVFKGPGTAQGTLPASPDRVSPAPASHDLCLVVGATASSWQSIAVLDVDTAGLQAFKPEPTRTPIAPDLLPWIARCGGPAAGINRVLQLPHGTDAMTLNSIQVPISLMTAEPMTIVVYDGAHPFAPMGTPPAPGATVAPRIVLPGEQDLCILVGADPATARRTIVEFGTPDVPSASGGPDVPSPSAPLPSSDAPSGSTAPASPSSVLRPEISAADCATLGFSDGRCLAVVERARATAGLEWARITAVHLAGPRPASVTFTLSDGTTATAIAACPGVGAQYDLVCTDHPEIPLAMPYGSGGGYWDVACATTAPNGDPAGCATPLPRIDPHADSVALGVPSQDYQLVLGHQEILVGQATLPNGILSDARFSLADPATQAFGVSGAVRLVIRSTDPARPAFGNGYEHGWYQGAEVVNVYLVLDVASITPGAALQVRDLVVR